MELLRLTDEFPLCAGSPGVSEAAAVFRQWLRHENELAGMGLREICGD